MPFRKKKAKMKFFFLHLPEEKKRKVGERSGFTHSKAFAVCAVGN